MAFFDLFRRSRPRRAPRARSRVRLGLETLENRWAPSGLDVLPSDNAEPPPDYSDAEYYKVDESDTTTKDSSSSDTGGDYDGGIGTDVGDPPPDTGDAEYYKVDESGTTTSDSSSSDTGGDYDVDVGTDVGEGRTPDVYP
jgi:hypothetical protein